MFKYFVKLTKLGKLYCKDVIAENSQNSIRKPIRINYLQLIGFTIQNTPKVENFIL